MAISPNDQLSTREPALYRSRSMRMMSLGSIAQTGVLVDRTGRLFGLTLAMETIGMSL